ncbi:hypothetical protein C8R42DRAFT_717053 [Lentinula raphanica]|nr:hypothetical protein C8R42DRAFT_717053 [Lentinula raphanica]
MHLLSSALSISLILGSIVRSVDGTPVPADSSQAGGSQAGGSQAGGSHMRPLASKPISQPPSLPPVPPGADFVMIIEGGKEAVGPNSQRHFNMLGTRCMDKWEGAMARNFVIWPNPVYLVDHHLNDRLFQWNSFGLSAAPGKTSTYCPHTSPCVGTFVRKTAVSWEWKIRSAAMNKDITFAYYPENWIAVGDGNAPVRQFIKRELEAVGRLALDHWGDNLAKLPKVSNMDAHPVDEAPLQFKFTMAGSKHSQSCPSVTETPCTGIMTYDHPTSSWISNVISPSLGTVVIQATSATRTITRSFGPGEGHWRRAPVITRRRSAGHNCRRAS